MQDAELDQNVGLVKALIGIQGVRVHHDQTAWIVTVDRPFHLPILSGGTDYVLTHELCIVEDAKTGTYQYAYTAD